MKRLCFDTEGDYYKQSGSQVLSLDGMRAFVHKNGYKIECAVVCDLETDTLHEFRLGRSNDKEALVALLGSADLLISHSGWLADLTVMEETYGLEPISPLREIPRYDLFEKHDWKSLTTLSNDKLPPAFVKAADDQYEKRWKQASIDWPDESKNWQHPNNRFEQKVGKAVRDVKLTTAVYRVVTGL